MKKKVLICLLLVAALLTSTVVCFSLDAHITRRQFFDAIGNALIKANVIKECDTASVKFTDYDGSDKVINGLIEKKYLLGVGDNKLDLDRELTLSDLNYFFPRVEWAKYFTGGGTIIRYISTGTDLDPNSPATSTNIDPLDPATPTDITPENPATPTDIDPEPLEDPVPTNPGNTITLPDETTRLATFPESCPGHLFRVNAGGFYECALCSLEHPAYADPFSMTQRAPEAELQTATGYIDNGTVQVIFTSGDYDGTGLSVSCMAELYYQGGSKVDFYRFLQVYGTALEGESLTEWEFKYEVVDDPDWGPVVTYINILDSVE